MVAVMASLTQSPVPAQTSSAPTNNFSAPDEARANQITWVAVACVLNALSCKSNPVVRYEVDRTMNPCLGVLAGNTDL